MSILLLEFVISTASQGKEAYLSLYGTLKSELRFDSVKVEKNPV